MAGNLLQSVMSMFQPTGGAQVIGPAGGQTQPQPPNNPSQVNNPGTPIPGSNPGNPAAPEIKEPVNPLDAIKDLWTPPDPKTNPAPETVADMFKGVDPKKLQESAGKIDFKGVATPEQIAKMAAGGQDAVNTMLEVMNSMSQRAYLQSTLAGIKVTETALNKADGIYRGQIPSLVKSAAAADGLRAQDSMDLSHPALAPIVNAFQTQFQIKNPNATAGEIQSQVVAALQAVGQVLNPGKTDSSRNAAKSQEEDWSSFLE